MKTEVKLCKNGQGIVIHVYEVDETKPIVQRVGCFYEFNSKLVASYFMSAEDLAKRLKNE